MRAACVNSFVVRLGRTLVVTQTAHTLGGLLDLGANTSSIKETNRKGGTSDVFVVAFDGQHSSLVAESFCKLGGGSVILLSCFVLAGITIWHVTLTRVRRALN